MDGARGADAAIGEEERSDEREDEVCADDAAVDGQVVLSVALSPE